jgi:hypothetical protein
MCTHTHRFSAELALAPRTGSPLVYMQPGFVVQHALPNMPRVRWHMRHSCSLLPASWTRRNAACRIMRHHMTSKIFMTRSRSVPSHKQRVRAMPHNDAVHYHRSAIGALACKSGQCLALHAALYAAGWRGGVRAGCLHSREPARATRRAVALKVCRRPAYRRARKA